MGGFIVGSSSHDNNRFLIQVMSSGTTKGNVQDGFWHAFTVALAGGIAVTRIAMLLSTTCIEQATKAIPKIRCFYATWTHRITASAFGNCCHCLLNACCCPNGTAGQGTAQHGTARHGTAQYGTAQHSTARHGTAQHSTEDEFN